MARLALAALLALALLGAAPAGAAFKGANGALAYEGRSSARGALILRDPGGRGGAQRLVVPGRPADPAFSPQGIRIAFTTNSEIWVMFASGANAREVTVSPQPSRDPTWSPAGDALAFARGYAGDRDLYAVTVDGTTVRRLTSGEGDDEAPAWSGKGRLAFVRHRVAGDDGDILLMPAAGGAARHLTTGGADDADPTWSPDGRRIAFTRLAEKRPRPKKGRRRPRRVRELFVVRSDGRFLRRVAKLPAAAGAPAWSPDGRRIAFTLGHGISVIRTGGRGLRRVVTGNARARALDWQPRGGADPVIAAAGDIACDPDSTRFRTGLGTATWCHMIQTSNSMLDMELSAVLPLGDIQYEDGTLDKFLRSFEPTWGRLKGIMHPVPGNHEYRTAGAAGYFDYFNGIGRANGLAGPTGLGYYSYDLGGWHLIALNSQCSHPPAAPQRAGCAAGSAQEQWLRADLAAHRNRCTLAYWHHPLYSSGIAGFNGAVQPLFRALYEAGADVLLTGHDHAYERFAPIDPDANRDGARGIRQFVVGTGGKNHEETNLGAANSEVRNSADFGVLQLTLHPASYSWRFAGEPGSRFAESGANDCH